MNVRDRRNRERSLHLHLLPRSVLSVLLALVLLGCALANQQTRPVNPIASPKPSVSTGPDTRSSDRIDRPTSEPYSGSLSLFEDPKREDRLQVNRVMDVLAIKSGSAVADVGAGSGWFTVREAKRVGSDGLYAGLTGLSQAHRQRSKEGTFQIPHHLKEQIHLRGGVWMACCTDIHEISTKVVGSFPACEREPGWGSSIELGKATIMESIKRP